MERSFARFLGVDLGGGRGKKTAVARLERVGEDNLEVVEVGTADGAGRAYHDGALLDALTTHAADAALAIDAPLTLPACIRCREPVCPTVAACVDPAVVWLRDVGAPLVAAAAAAERDQIAAVPSGRASSTGTQAVSRSATRPLVTPYTQRATEVVLHRLHGIVPRETLGQSSGPLTARAAHLVRVLAGRGFELGRNLIEVDPKATITKLWGPRAARRYRREAGTWETRAAILESLRGQVEFARTSRLAREDCLRSDHCFDAVIAAYTAFLWARDGWTLPELHRQVFVEDGWIFAPGM